MIRRRSRTTYLLPPGCRAPICRRSGQRRIAMRAIVYQYRRTPAHPYHRASSGVDSCHRIRSSHARAAKTLLSAAFRLRQHGADPRGRAAAHDEPGWHRSVALDIDQAAWLQLKAAADPPRRAGPRSLRRGAREEHGRHLPDGGLVAEDRLEEAGTLTADERDAAVELKDFRKGSKHRGRSVGDEEAFRLVTRGLQVCHRLVSALRRRRPVTNPAAPRQAMRQRQPDRLASLPTIA
jgi:hypothetical protein